MLVLAIDTSTPVVSAGIARVPLPSELMAAATPPTPVAVLAERSVADPFAAAEQLMPLVSAALAGAGTTLKALDAVVVGVGPGPFTGLRVGIATAAALGDGLARPVHGVGSHHAIALSVAEPPGAFLVITDARRREVYASAYQAGRPIGGPVVLPPAALPEFIEQLPAPPVAVSGAGAELVDLDLPRLPIGSLSHGLVLAAGLALVTGAVPGPLTPRYLRRPDATEPGTVKSVPT